MFKSIKEKAHKLKRNLTSLDNQPLGKAALIVIVFLDLFILISIFDGLADHTAQLPRPEQFIPQDCRDIVIDADWNETNRLARVAHIAATHHGSYYLPNEKNRSDEQHAMCAPITRSLWAIRDDESLSRSLAETLKLQQQSAELRSQLEHTKGAYDTSLLETIARQDQGQANVDSIRANIAGKTNVMNNLARTQKLLETSLEQDPRLRDLFALIAGVTEADRIALRDELRRLNFWYPVKRLGMEMIFLLPLFLVFYVWNSKSIAGNRPFQALVSSHLIVLVMVPVFFKIVELIYDIVPKKLLRHVIELLQSLKLVALWHYLLMAAAILAGLALIYLFQKKLFSRERLIERRIARGLCQECNQRLPADSCACPFCGFVQYRACRQCNQPTYVHGKFCRECGHGAGETTIGKPGATQEV